MKILATVIQLSEPKMTKRIKKEQIYKVNSIFSLI